MSNKKCLQLLVVILATLFVSFPTYSETDDEIKKNIIQSSIARYPGNCPCSYHVDRAGRRCGRRSAYSRPGGYAPICYLSDVTSTMVETYKKRHKQ